MPTAADMGPGSRLPVAPPVETLGVGSEAVFAVVLLLPPPHAASIETAPTATARERNTAIRVIPPPTKHGSRRAHSKTPSSTSIALFPLQAGRECAGDGYLPPCGGPATPSSVLDFASPKSSSDNKSGRPGA